MNEAVQIIAREAGRVVEFVIGRFWHTWPLWVVSIPLAALIKTSPLASRLKRVLSMSPAVSVIAATAFGAVSPLCSCSVVPVVFSLLSAGAPLAPVMAFWLASPSMDPEIFFLSVSSLGWPLAAARLAAATLMSLAGGFIALTLERRGWFAGGVLRNAVPDAEATGGVAGGATATAVEGSRLGLNPSGPRFAPVSGVSVYRRAEVDARPNGFALGPVAAYGAAAGSACGCSGGGKGAGAAASPRGGIQGSTRAQAPRGFAARFGRELISSLGFVAKFMAIAYALEAAITFYVPEAWVAAALGADNAFAVPLATLVGIPFYTTNAQALGMVGGLLGKGMGQGAALAFLIGGATTTLPAMSAVFGIAKPRVFAVYLGSAMAGSLIAGLLWSLIA